LEIERRLLATEGGYGIDLHGAAGRHLWTHI